MSTNPSAESKRYRNLTAGDPAPWFKQASTANARFTFDTVAGRYLVLCLFGTAAEPRARAALDFALSRRRLFDDVNTAFFGVSIDPADQAQGRVAQSLPGIRHFWDFDLTISRLYGAAPEDGEPTPYRPLWVVLDPQMRVIAALPFRSDGEDQTALIALLETLPPVSRFTGIEVAAPILYLPNVFEPDFCRHLIDRYEAAGGEESGFMREVNGKTMLVHDPDHKRRSDHLIEDADLIAKTQARILRRIVPEIQKAHQFTVTRMERYLVACYDADSGGHFRPHRDNTTKGTAHRRFAVSINLNDDFDGGEIAFPEYGPRTYKAPPGGAVVFSCSLLHAVTPVTRGRRYAFLPFLYDEAAAKLREQNNAFLGEGVGSYSAA